jgi:carboxyl-terminal processing protease
MLNIYKQFRLVIFFLVFISLFFVLGIIWEREVSSVDTFIPKELNIVSANTDDIIDMEPFWTVWELLDEKYVATNKQSSTTKILTNEDRVWGAIKGMTDSLGDPYTVFLPPEEAKDFQENINGNFEGVGMEIGIKEGVLTVVAPLKGSPAESAGLKSGDKIITIDDKTAVDLSTDQAVKLIRGQKGTVVKISVIREGESKPLNFEIVRAVINIPTLKTEKREDGIFVISLYNFYAQSKKEFTKALKEFSEAKTDKLILDLRGNPGGYLDISVDMASYFLPLGKPIVREDFGNSEEEKIYRSKGYNIFTDKLKMIILVDNGSASASEILAGALQEYNIAKLVGTKTYGKGSVQELVPVTKNSSLKVTIAKWLTPNGISISEGGLTPDYEVKITEEDLKDEKDTQMLKAVELLLK